MTNVKEYLNKMVVQNNEGNTNEMSDLADYLMDDLIENGHLTRNLLPTEKGLNENMQIVNIIHEVRKSFQQDHEDVKDFSYVSVAFDLLRENGITVTDN